MHSMQISKFLLNILDIRINNLQLQLQILLFFLCGHISRLFRKLIIFRVQSLSFQLQIHQMIFQVLNLCRNLLKILRFLFKPFLNMRSLSLSSRTRLFIPVSSPTLRWIPSSIILISLRGLYPLWLFKHRFSPSKILKALSSIPLKLSIFYSFLNLEIWSWFWSPLLSGKFFL